MEFKIGDMVTPKPRDYYANLTVGRYYKVLHVSISTNPFSIGKQCVRIKDDSGTISNPYSNLFELTYIPIFNNKLKKLLD